MLEATEKQPDDFLFLPKVHDDVPYARHILMASTPSATTTPTLSHKFTAYSQA